MALVWGAEVPTKPHVVTDSLFPRESQVPNSQMIGTTPMAIRAPTEPLIDIHQGVLQTYLDRHH
jgi:hypothetical protein